MAADNGPPSPAAKCGLLCRILGWSNNSGNGPAQGRDPIEAGWGVASGQRGGSVLPGILRHEAIRIVRGQLQAAEHTALTSEVDFVNSYAQQLAYRIPFSPIPKPPENTTAQKAASWAGLIAMFAIPEDEGGSLLSRWGSGTWEGEMATEVNIFKHWQEYGESVEATSVEQYLRKSVEFAKNLRGAKSYPIEETVGAGVKVYIKQGRFIIMDAAGRIVSFGKAGI